MGHICMLAVFVVVHLRDVYAFDKACSTGLGTCPSCAAALGAINRTTDIFGNVSLLEWVYETDTATGKKVGKRHPSGSAHPAGLVFVAHALQLIYMPIPKSASSTWRMHLINLNATPVLYSELTPSELAYTTFTVVRDPALRFLSGLGSLRARSCKGCFTNATTAVALAEAVLDRLAAEPFFDEHVVPQALFMRDGMARLLRLDFVVPLEASDSFLKCVSDRAAGLDTARHDNIREGDAHRPRTWDMLPSAIRKRVCNAYAVDYSCFGCLHTQYHAMCRE